MKHRSVRMPIACCLLSHRRLLDFPFAAALLVGLAMLHP